MILTEKQKIEFEQNVKPIMKWLAENFNPHVKVIIDSTDAEILEGSAGIVTDEFIVD